MNDRSARLLGLLGLGARGGKLVIGVDATRAALQGGRADLVVKASDASPRAMEKVVRLARAKSVPVVDGPAAEAIGSRLGRPPVMMVAVRDRDLAAGLLAAVGGPEGR
ncbi:MAG TPA: ribosomal L7Ae/L30e/S12e/Gadd45 family protein [Gemmatimonadales bacterium]|nr:ribosomal L7Ae/L30e/S12e/Gadd45 family protein [Gemmatimonadales bacterium]